MTAPIDAVSGLVEELRALADCDSRAGEPLGKCMRRAADALEAQARELAEARAETLELRAKVAIISRGDCTACHGTGAIEDGSFCSACAGSGIHGGRSCSCHQPRIKAKFKRTWECANCGLPECSSPSALDQYKARIAALEDAVRVKDEALRACHAFLSDQSPNNDSLLDMIDATLMQGNLSDG